MIELEEAEKIYLNFNDIENSEIEQVPGLKNGLKKLDGHYLPTYVRNFSIIKSLELRDQDTFVIGYPKSGTTWMEEIVWLIQNNADVERASKIFHFQRVLFIDRGIPSEFIKMAESPRVFKTHLLPHFLPNDINENAKIVYVVRNPKDIVVSQYNFFRSLSWDPFEGTFDDLVELFLKGSIWYGAWWKHVDTYANLPNVKLIHYEDLIQKPFEKVKELCEYLGKSLTDSQINQIIHSTSFENMKNNPALDLKLLSKYDIVDESVEFFKKGEIGQWYECFSKEMSDRFDNEIKKNLNYKGNFYYGQPKFIGF